MKNVVLMIPAYNPEENLIEYVKECIDAGFDKILIINDGSREDRNFIFDALREIEHVCVIEHEVNKGKGRALKTGFAYVLDNYKDVVGVVTADSDGQHLCADVIKTAKCLEDNPDSLVLGTRNFNEPQVPPKSRFGNKTTTFFFFLLYGKKINDTQTGLRGMGINYLPDLVELEGERFEYEIRMLIDAARKKMDIKEVIIETVYINDNRETHFNPIKDSYKIYKIMFACFFKFIFASASSAVIDIALFAIFSHFIFAGLGVTCNIWLSTVLARVISAVYNYTFNKKVVFESKESVGKTATGYFVLAVLQMLCSAGLVSVFVNILATNKVVTKLIVDIILFLISFQIQQKIIFKK